MKLYYFPAACSLSPHITLFASGLPFSAELLDLQQHPRRTASGVDFYSLNPRGCLPLLELNDGRVLTEGAAILQYLADLVPEKNLAPANGTWERYKLQEALSYIATELHKSFAHLFQPITEELKQTTWEKLDRHFDLLDTQLSQHTYFTGEQFSIADAYLFTVLNWGDYLEHPFTEYPFILAYQNRVRALPWTQQALKAEGLL